MFLEGKVQTAKVSDFYDGLEITVIDSQAIKPMGGRPQYTCKIIKGLPEVEQLKVLSKQLKKREVSEQQVAEFAMQVPLPQEDAVLRLHVVDVTGKNGYIRFICELMP